MQDLNPELFSEAVAKGADFLERHGMDFGKWSLLMAHLFGEQIRPDLEGIWTCAHDERLRRQAGAPTHPRDGQPSPTSEQLGSRRRWELSNLVVVSILAVIVGLLLVSVWLGWQERTAQKVATEVADAAKEKRPIDFEPNAPDGLKDLKARAEKGDAEAQFSLALESDLTKEYAEAVKWYRRAAGAGHAQAEAIFGECFFFGRGVVQDYAEATSWWRKAADQGLVEAQGNLAVTYFYGLGVSTDYGEALRYARLAAERGHAGAQHALGALFAGGFGVPQDYTEAVRWFRKAAAQGLPQSQGSLGVCYGLGWGVRKDSGEAARWLLPAANSGIAPAQFILGVLYRDGGGVPLNYAEAARWFREAAHQGVDDAQTELGRLYATGRGVPRDDRKAVEMFWKAAEQGSADAQNLLGGCYWFGDGVPHDFVEAFKWFNLAAAQGNEGAREQRDRLVFLEHLTRQQVAEGQRRASLFVAKKDYSDRDKAPGLVIPIPYERSSGSGFFITDDGYLLSNSHVVEHASRVRVKTNRGMLPAEVVKSDPVNDIALLKVSGSFWALPIAGRREARMGESIFTVGFPNVSLQGIEPKLTKGEINSLSGAQDDPRHFQISAAVQPGNSGGPLLDAFGNVIGIVTARLSDAAALETSGALPQNVNYAIKISYALPLLESLPGLTGKLKASHPAKERKFEDAVQEARDATVLVLVF